MNIGILVMPLVGATIGYSTNWVAIQMLFHPRRAYSILGWRIPMTPGLIPRYREDLEKKIAESMTKLINAEEVRHHLKLLTTRRRLRHRFENELDSNPISRLVPMVVRGVVFDFVLDRVLNSLDGFITPRDVKLLVHRSAKKIPNSELETRVKDVASSSLTSITNAGAALGFFVGLAQYLLMRLI